MKKIIMNAKKTIKNSFLLNLQIEKMKNLYLDLIELNHNP